MVPLCPSLKTLCVGLMLLLPAVAMAQVPAAVLLTRLRVYRQMSPQELRTVGFGIGAQVMFQTAAPTGTVIELRGPNNRVRPFRVAAPDEYELVEEFSDEASLLAAYPDGTYTVVVGGNNGSSTSVTLRGGAPLTPVRFTNFAELQGMRADRLEVSWEPIAGATAGDRLAFTVEDITGRELFSTPDSFSPTRTSVTVTSFVSPAVPLTGTLVFGRFASATTNSGRTVVASGDGFAVQVSMMRLESPPTLVFPPSSVMLRPGVITPINVWANRATSYEWRRNGTVLPSSGSSLMLRGEAAEAGTYTVTVINSAGRVTSDPFVVAVAPALATQRFAGQSHRRGNMDGAIDAALFTEPTSIAVDRASGALYVIDRHAVRKISGGQVSTLAGVVDEPGMVDGSGGAARFMSPRCIAVGPTGEIYVGDAGERTSAVGSRNHRVRRISPTGQVSTLPQSATEPYSVGLIAVDPAGVVYTAGPNHQVISRITPTGVISRLSLREGSQPLAVTAMAIDGTGALFVADGASSGIFRVAPNGEATRYAGSEIPPTRDIGSAGVGTGVRVLGIDSMAFDSAGNLFAAGYAAFWMITPDRRIIYLGDERPGSSEESGKIAVDASGAVYLSKAGDATIVAGRVTPGSVAPQIAIVAPPVAQTVAPGDAVALSVNATGPGLSYQWLRNGVMLPRENDATLVLRNVRDAADYAVVVGNALGVVTTPAVRVAVEAAATPGRIVNLSLRSRAGSGAESLIMGFVVGGGTDTRDALVRAVGPGLRRFGVEGVLADPQLVLASGGAELASNDDFGTQPAVVSVAAAVGAFALDTGSKDAALVVPLSPNAYTAQVRGANGAEGVALAEAYDATPSTRVGQARFVNVSARTVAGGGDETLSAGLVIGGATAKTVLIRAVGPGLAPFRVGDTLLNPRLDVFSGSARLAGNDNWSGEALPGLFQAVGAFPLEPQSYDAAMVITLRPGPYTVVVTGAPVVGVTGGRAERGVALIEIYEVR